MRRGRQLIVSARSETTSANTRALPSMPGSKTSGAGGAAAALAKSSRILARTAATSSACGFPLWAAPSTSTVIWSGAAPGVITTSAPRLARRSGDDVGDGHHPEPGRLGRGGQPGDGDLVGGTVDQIDGDEVEPGPRRGDHEVVARKPHDDAAQRFARRPPRGKRHRATIPAERSMSAACRPRHLQHGDDGLADLLALDEAVQQRPRDERLRRRFDRDTEALRLEAEVAVHARPAHGSRRQAVDGDAERADFGGKRRRQPEHGHLRRAVGSAPGKRAFAADRGDVDDVAGAPFDHLGEERTTHQVHAAHVDGEDLVPVGGLHVDERSDGPGDAGVVDEDRDRLVGEVGAERADTGRVGHIDRCRADLAAGCGRQRGGLGEGRLGSTGGDDACAGRGQCQGDRPAEAVATAGDERRTPGERCCRFSHSRRPGRSRAATTAGRGRRTSPPAHRPSGRGPRTARPVRRARRARRGLHSHRGR